MGSARACMSAAKSSPMMRPLRAEVAMKVQGSCRCGKIIYTAEVDPERVLVCRCIDSPASIPAPAGSFQVSSGEPMRIIGVAESGTIRLDSVCGDCESVIYSSAAAEPQNYWLYTFWLKERSELRPKRIIRCHMACGATEKRQPPCWRDKREDLKQAA